MPRQIEKYVPVVRLYGLNTNKPAVFGSTLSVAGNVTVKTPRYLGAITDYDAQAAVLTVAGIAGGTVTQNSKTGASTFTTPTGTEISTSVGGSTVGTMLDVVYHNRGNQTSTITAGASGITLAGSTVAIATLKTAMLRFVCTGSNTWTCYIIASA